MSPRALTVAKPDRAAALLSEAGFYDVQALRGGMEQWNRDGMTVAGKTA